MRASSSTLKEAPRSTGCGKMVPPPVPATSVSPMKDTGMPKRDALIMEDCSHVWHAYWFSMWSQRMPVYSVPKPVAL